MPRPPWPHLPGPGAGRRPPQGAEAGRGQRWRDGAWGAVLRDLGTGRSPWGPLEMADSQKAQLCPDPTAGMIHGQGRGRGCWY